MRGRWSRRGGVVIPIWNVVDSNKIIEVSIVVWRRRRASTSTRGRCKSNDAHKRSCAAGEVALMQTVHAMSSSPEHTWDVVSRHC